MNNQPQSDAANPVQYPPVNNQYDQYNQYAQYQQPQYPNGGYNMPQSDGSYPPYSGAPQSSSKVGYILIETIKMTTYNDANIL